MSPTCADLLFALPARVERAMLLPGVEGWVEPLRNAGIEIVEEAPCDLVVARPSEFEKAASSGASMVIVIGNVARRRSGRAGLVGERFLPMPSVDSPSILLPLERPRGAAYVLSRLQTPPTRAKAVRNRLLAQAVRLGVKPPGTLTLASRAGEPPLLVGASTQVGMQPGVDWVLVLGRAVERGVFHLFESDKSLPSWVLKFSRAPVAPVEPPADVHGLGLIADLGDGLAAHAPTLVGVARADGRTFIVESAAVGAPLVQWLRSTAPEEEKRAVIDAVAGWLVALGAASLTRADPTALRAALDAARTVAGELAVDFDALLTSLEGLPTVMAHGDPGLEHVIVDAPDFVVIDWEAAHRPSLPFLDLAYFLAQALSVLDGEADDPRYERHEPFVRLFRGDSPSSPTLMRWFAQACDAWGVPHDALGPLLSVIWLIFAEVEPRRHLAEGWFADPSLGPTWSIPS